MWIRKVKNTIFFFKKLLFVVFVIKMLCIILIVLVAVSYIFVNFALVIITNRLNLGQG